MSAGGSSAITDWPALLRQIPGYDPSDQAGDCWFDEGAAQLALDFFPEMLRHVEGKLTGQPFVLQPWQQAIVANLFGWKNKDGSRRYREAFIEVPRKNGKTPLASAIALYVFFCDSERGKQCYLAAADRENAGALYRQCKGMVEREPELAARCRAYGGNAPGGQSRSLVAHDDASFLKVIAADAERQHGGNTSLAVIDELHVQPSRDLVDVLTTSMASANRANPLLIHVTTAGHDRRSICWEKYAYACRVRDNGGDPDKPGYDPAFLPVIYEIGPEDDWTSEDVWAKANPNLGVSVSLEYLRRECKRAQEVPDYENTFRQLHLDQWTEQATRWLSMAAWAECGALPLDPEALAGCDCYAGLDLASTKDTTACVLVFPLEDGGVALVCRFWVPGAMVEARVRAKQPEWRAWAKGGHLTVTEGDWCDYTVVEKDVLELCERYNVLELAYDPREASMLAQRLQGAGVKVIPFTQSFANYNEPTKHFEQLVGQGKLRHGNHPVLNWMAAGVALDRNIGGLRLPSKAKSADKIDGIVAACMGLGRLLLEAPAGEPTVTEL